jgi:IS5 family transposase
MLSGQILQTINGMPQKRGCLLKGGTVVDATIIHASGSTKNRERQRDPETRQTKKGRNWFFGMKAHVGADVRSGLARTVGVTPANVADVSALPRLLREVERGNYSNKGDGRWDYKNTTTGNSNEDFIKCFDLLRWNFMGFNK